MKSNTCLKSSHRNCRTSPNRLSRPCEKNSVTAADWASLGSGTRGKACYRYGLWSEREGLVSRPLAAQNNDRQLRSESEHLIEQTISSNLNRLPFALTGRRELWLPDVERQETLALLHAMSPGANPPRPARLLPRNHYPSEL